MSRQIQESIDFGDCDPFRSIGDLHDIVARTNFSFLQHAKVKPRSVVCDQQRWHPRLAHADADAVAGYARLRYLEYRVTNLISVTNADLVIGESFNREVLPELTATEIAAP
jgi:hypothetical protein